MWRLEFTPEAEVSLSKLDADVRKRVAKKLEWLADNFDHVSPEPLSHELAGKYKLRVGDYRVIYSFEEEKRIIQVYLIGHRSKIYRLS